MDLVFGVFFDSVLEAVEFFMEFAHFSLKFGLFVQLLRDVSVENLNHFGVLLGSGRNSIIFRDFIERLTTFQTCDNA